jgi:hypothetical protein
LKYRLQNWSCQGLEIKQYWLVEEMVTENRKTVELGAKEYMRRVKEWSKKSK